MLFVFPIFANFPTVVAVPSELQLELLVQSKRQLIPFEPLASAAQRIYSIIPQCVCKCVYVCVCVGCLCIDFLLCSVCALRASELMLPVHACDTTARDK